jgi:asparagine synthase (glutamine-hydrolysing)
VCGIVGIVPREPADPERLERAVRRMAGAIVHRGPDDEGFYVTPRVALGMRRLSILDLAGGQQPMFTSGRGKAIVYNGEVYNHPSLRRELEGLGRGFETTCDTETVLTAFDVWGADAFRRMEGMFAAAIWDEARATLTLVRDWLGQKSLYLAELPVGLAFASEIKALLALGEIHPRLDLRVLSHYMTLRYLPGEATFFEGVTKLPAAHRLEVRGGERVRERIWTPRYEPKHEGSQREVLDGLDALLGEVVAEHLLSDVPLGCFLSGGIDSSLVVAYAARAAGEPVRTFSIGVHEASQSELPWARRVAERYGTRHFERMVAPDLAGLTPRMVAAMEEPVDPFSAGVYLVSEVAAEHVTVCLGGDGGDELFAGYDRYLGQRLAEIYALVPAVLRRQVLRPLLRLTPESFGYKSFATKLRWLDAMADRSGFERYAESAAFLRFPHELKARLFAPSAWRELGGVESEPLLRAFFEDGCAEHLIDRMMHTDCMTRLADHQLPIVDKMSMAHSLEVRSPFLDRRVAEYAARIPAAWHLAGGRLKAVTRRLGERYLPRELVVREKQGFGFPLGLWLRGELRTLIEQVVDHGVLAEAGIFRREELKQLVAEHVGGAIDHNFRLWMIFNLELFYRHHIAGEPVAALEDWVARARAGRLGS